ncbi:MAG TPA: Sir2 family NAD-dependent protein deacetylase [Candidatus Brocadiia bacterium]|nr:Sir2 family NAD-dependent protein deacetylase [Candidatus Brocadiia bacterium]
MDLTPITAKECAAMIRGASRAVALTGAGISTSAGIPDFRGPKGLYVTRRYDPDTVFNIDHFQENPKPFYDFTRDFVKVLDRVRPTFTHRFLAALEKRGLLRGVITQNIDSLHEKAGSREVASLHGSYATSRCMVCRKSWTYDEMVEWIGREDVPRCACGGLVKPEVVFFGEIVRDLATAGEWAESCDLMLALGSSLTVYPAAALPEMCRGSVVAVNQGAVSLPPGPGRYWAEEDLDTFFRLVARELDMNVE